MGFHRLATAIEAITVGMKKSIRKNWRPRKSPSSMRANPRPRMFWITTVPKANTITFAIGANAHSPPVTIRIKLSSPTKLNCKPTPVQSVTLIASINTIGAR